MGLFSKLFGSPIPDIEATQAQTRLRGQPVPFLLDVRQPEEYQAGHIESARLIPLGELAARAAELPHDREVICVCHSGNRSSHATRQLIALGFQASNLRGGMIAWAQAGLPVTRGSAR